MSKRRRLTALQRKAILADETKRENLRKPITLAATPIVSRDKSKHLVSVAVDLMRDWRDNRWEHEAEVRYGMRTGFILDGHGWRRSDDQAAEIVSKAFVHLGRGTATRPSKDEGQAYHTFPRENCRWCFGPIDADDMRGGRSRTFCSDHCAKTAYIAWDMRNAANGRAVEREAYRAVYRDRMPSRECEQCGKSFKVQTTARETRFCSMGCFTDSLKLYLPERECGNCHRMFQLQATNVNAKFCGKACADEALRVYQPTPCKICATSFIPKTAAQMYCSQACAHKGKQLREVECTCRCCGRQFIGKRADAEYCGKTCERFAYRVRTGRITRLSVPVLDYIMRRQGVRITEERMAA